MQEINPDAFVELIRRRNVPLKDFKIDQPLVIGDGNLPENNSSITITNCSFNTISFGRSASYLEFNNCTVGSLKISGQIFNIKISNCQIDTLGFDIGGLQNQGHSNVTIVGQESNLDSVTFEGEYNSILISDVSRIRNMNLKDMRCQNNVTLSKVKGGRIYFRKFNAQRFLALNSSECSIDFYDCAIDGETAIADPKNVSLSFSHFQSKTIIFSEGKYDLVRFRGGCNFNLRFTYVPMNSSNKRTSLENLQISDFQLSNNGRMRFSDLTIDNLLVEDFDNSGTLDFYNSEIIKSLKIDQSNLGRTTLSNVSIEKCKISLTNSNITDTIFTNFKWNTEYQIDEHNYLPAIRESYRQLKANYNKNGNKIEALEFQKNELRMHYEILFQRRFNGLKDFGNYLIVVTNKWSSDFGQNIWKPLLFLFGFHFLFFNGFLFANCDLGVHAAFNWDSELFLRGVRLYFQTLLPVHSTEIRFADGAVVPIAGFWDFLIRVSSGYFIFYFVSVSRKYHQ